MDWVTDGIAIGGMRDALDFQTLETEGVEAVLQLCGHQHEQVGFPLPIEVLQLPVEDRRPLDGRLLRQGVKFIRRQRLAGRKVLVCCGAGMSRSPTFVAAYLYEEGTDLATAFRLLRERRAEVHPHREMVRSLAEHYGLDVEAHELLAEIRR